jgi:acyl-coenzyme A thioesterase 13
MAPRKLAVNMPGVAPGKALAGIPVGDETAEERVRALLGGTVTDDSYQVSVLLFSILN